MPKILSCLLIFTVCAASSLAVASERKSEAERHFKAGTTLLKNEDFLGAVVELETSVKLYPTKAGLFNLANCYKAVREYNKALSALKRLKLVFGDEFDEEMSNAVEGLLKDIQVVVGELVVHVDQDGATVEISGKVIGKTPIEDPVLLGAGPHTINVSKEGYKTKSLDIKLISGDVVVKRVKLEPATSDASVSSALQSTEPKKPSPVIETSDRDDVGLPLESEASVGIPAEDLSSSEGERINGPLVAGVVSLVLGVGAGAVGGYYTFKYREHSDDSNDDMASATTRNDAKDALQSDKTGMIAGYITSSGLVTTAVVLIVIGKLKTNRRDDEKSSEDSVSSVSLGMGPRALGLSVSF